MATSNLNLGGGAWFDKNFYDLLRENITPGAYTSDQVQDAIKGSSWYGRLGSGSNPYGAMGEVLSRLGQNINSNYSPPVITGKDAMPYYFSGYNPMPEGVKYYGIPNIDPDDGMTYEDRNFFDAAGNRAIHKNAEYDEDTGALISPGGWEIQPGAGARDETLEKYKAAKQSEYVANQGGYWRRQAEDRSPEGIARANDENDDRLFGSLSPLFQIGASVFGGPLGAGAFSLVNSGGDIESALKAAALTYAGQELSGALGGGSTPSITDELSFADGNYWDGAAALSGDAAASYPVETIANPQSFELPATPTDVPFVESVPDYVYDVSNDPYFAPEPVSPLSPPATFDPNSINADIYNAPPPSGPATGSGVSGLNNSIYQPVLQSLTDAGVPWEVVQALPSVMNSSLQGGALSSLTGGSFGTGAGMGAISSVLGNYLNSKGYNVPTSLLGAATSIIGSGLGLFDGAAGTSGSKGTTGVGGATSAGRGVSPDVLKNALASLQPPQSGASPIRQFLQPSLLNTQGGGSPLALWQGLTPAQTQVRAKTGGSISELSDNSEIHPSLRNVLQGRGYGVDFVPGPENKLYAKHDIRGFAVGGSGTGQSDDIPTMLSDGEYVIDADTVAALGDGSSKAGASALDKMREKIRHHKRSASIKNIPPKAKSPLEYLKGNKHG